MEAAEYIHSHSKAASLWLGLELYNKKNADRRFPFYAFCGGGAEVSAKGKLTKVLFTAESALKLRSQPKRDCGADPSV